MTKISQYETDESVNGDDKWIGSDANSSNRTKNFTPLKLAEYFNDNAILNSEDTIVFKYIPVATGEQRSYGSLSFDYDTVGPIYFSDVTYFIISKRTIDGDTITQFAEFMTGTKCLIHDTNNVNKFFVFKVVSVEPQVGDSQFLRFTVEHIDSNGDFIVDDSYGITIKELPVEPKISAIVDADLMVINDSEDSFATKTFSFGYIKSVLKTYFDTIYTTISSITLQAAYNNLNIITTNNTLKAFTLKRGSAADTDNIIVGQNGAGTNTFHVKGNGESFIGGNLGIGQSSPTAKLHVNGTSLFVGQVNIGNSTFIESASNTYALNVNGNNITPGIAFGSLATVGLIQGYNKTFSATNSISLQPTANNVLIGTTTDNGVDKLQVNGSISTGTLLGGVMQNVLYATANSDAALFQRRSSFGPVIRIGRQGASANTTIDYPTDSSFAISTVGVERLRISGNDGNLMLGTTTDNGVDKLQVNGSVAATQFKLSALNTAPASATATGTTGEIRVDANFVYVCTATNTWKRTPLSSW